MKKISIVLVLLVVSFAFTNLEVFRTYAVSGGSSVGIWHFDEGTGVLAHDSSGNGNDGKLHGGVTWIDGKIDEALNFGGSSGFVEVPDSDSLDVIGKLTLEAWIYPRAMDHAQVILCKYNHTTLSSSYYLSLGGTVTTTYLNKIYYALTYDGNHYYAMVSNANITANTWTHVAAVCNVTHMSIYINGVLDKVRTYPPGYIFPGTAKLRIGCYLPEAGYSRYFNGTIDEARVAAGVVWTVDDDRVQCPNADFLKIQDAINAANAGDTILVHDGTYDESLYINKNLVIKAASNPVISGGQLRATNYGNRQATIFVEDAADVVLQDLDIEGQGLGIPTGTKSYAVLYENSGGTLERCTVSPNTIGDMYSAAIAVWDNSDVSIKECLVGNFGRIGIYCNNATLDIEGNTIIGQTYSQDNLVAYGIEIEDYSGPSIANIDQNTIYNCNNTHPSPLWSSAAIIVDTWREWADYYNLALLPSKVAITNNYIYDNFESIEIVANEFSYAHGNKFYNNAYGMWSAPENWTTNPTYYVFDARHNRWSPLDDTGPFHNSSWTYLGNPYGPHMGNGDPVSNYILYDPWELSYSHDVSVTQLTATPDMVQIGETVSIAVTVKNLGDIQETFNVTTTYGSAVQIGTIIGLQPGDTATLTYDWDTTGESKCSHQINADAGPVLGDTYLQNNHRSTAVNLVPLIPNPTTVKVEPALVKGLRDLYVNVTVKDLDAYWDMSGFDIELHYNTTMLDVVSVELGDFALQYDLTFQVVEHIDESLGYVQVAFMWNISIPPEQRLTPAGNGTLFTIAFRVTAAGQGNIVLGNIVLAAFPNNSKWCTETSIPIEHLAQSATVRTALPIKEDINADGVVNILDVVAASSAYGSREGDPNWNPYADLNGDGVINILDIVMITRVYGMTYDP